MSNTYRFKFDFDCETRRLDMPFKSNRISYSQLMEMVVKLFKYKLQEKEHILTLKWKDEEGDEISCSSSDELVLALKIFQMQSKKLMRFAVTATIGKMVKSRPSSPFRFGSTSSDAKTKDGCSVNNPGKDLLDPCKDLQPVVVKKVTDIDEASVFLRQLESNDISALGGEASVFSNLKAIVDLGSDDANRIKFGSVGGCEALIQALVRHQNVPLVVEQVNAAIWNMEFKNEANATKTSNAKYKAKLWELDNADMLIRVMNRYLDVPGVVHKICFKLLIMCWETGYGCPDKKTEIGKAGGCEALVRALARHQDNADVAKQACWALKYLSPGRIWPNLDTDRDITFALKIKEARGCEALVEALNRHQDVPAVVEGACGAIHYMCSGYGDDKDEIRVKLGSLGTCEALVQALARAGGWEALVRGIARTRTLERDGATWRPVEINRQVTLKYVNTRADGFKDLRRGPKLPLASERKYESWDDVNKYQQGTMKYRSAIGNSASEEGQIEEQDGVHEAPGVAAMACWAMRSMCGCSYYFNIASNTENLAKFKSLGIDPEKDFDDYILSEAINYP